MKDASDQTEPVNNHLSELRSRLRNYLLSFFLFSSIFFWKSNDVLAFFEQDLGLELFSLKVQEVFYTQLRVAIVLGFVASFPILVYELFRYMWPGLKQNERKALALMGIPAVGMFYTGVLFGYEVVSAYVIRFFAKVTSSSGFQSVWGLQASLETVLRLSLITGFLFEIPVMVFALGIAGVISPDDLSAYRNHVLVGLLVLSAILTPPDIISQVVIVVPLMLMYLGTEAALRFVKDS